MTTTALILAALVIGFLAGQRRAVRQCNVILDERLRDLLNVMLPDAPIPPERDGEETRPTVH